jgi:hypothetical protein
MSEGRGGDRGAVSASVSVGTAGASTSKNFTVTTGIVTTGIVTTGIATTGIVTTGTHPSGPLSGEEDREFGM